MRDYFQIIYEIIHITKFIVIKFLNFMVHLYPGLDFTYFLRKIYSNYFNYFSNKQLTECKDRKYFDLYEKYRIIFKKL
ncbi:MAG: hypothetical protein ACP5IB_05805 [Thermoplasmata archaeon]